MWVIVGLVLGLATSTAAAPSATPDSASYAGNELALRAYAQGRLLEARGSYREALGEYIRALSLDHHAAAVPRRVAELVGRIGDAPSAIEYADKALAIDSTDARSLWIKGAALMSLGRTPEALAPLVACVNVDSTHAEYVAALAHAAEAAERIDIVAHAYELAVELDPDDGESWFQLAAAQARLGRFAEADSSMRQAADLSPVRPGQLFLQGWIAESLGRDDEAIERYQSHLETHPNDQTTRRRLVNLLARQKRWALALPEAQRVTRADPNDWETLAVEAEIAIRAGKTAEAKSAIDRLERQAEHDVDLAGGVCSLLIRCKRVPDAIQFADGWASRHLRDPDGPLLAARARAVAGQREAALPFARAAVLAAPDSLSPRLLLARLCTDLHRYPEAESSLTVLAARRPAEAVVLLEVASLREDRGDTEHAEAAARDALKLEPDNARLLNFLGYLMADHDRGLDEAERMIRRALVAEPDNGAYVDSMGWVLYRKHQFEAARTQLERAVELTAGDPVVREHLGDAYVELKLKDRAREQYKLCLERDSGNTRVRAKLAGIPR